MAIQERKYKRVKFREFQTPLQTLMLEEVRCGRRNVDIDVTRGKMR